MKTTIADISPSAESDNSYQNEVQELTETIARRWPLLYRTALNRLHNPADAEDALQDAFLSAYAHLHQFKREAEMSTWLTRIVINAARMIARRRRVWMYVSLDGTNSDQEGCPLHEILPDRRPTPEDICQNSELESRIAELAKQLKPSWRKAYVLRDVNGLSTLETAELLGVQEGTVKSRIGRARGRIIEMARHGLRKKRPKSRSPMHESYCPPDLTRDAAKRSPLQSERSFGPSALCGTQRC